MMNNSWCDGAVATAREGLPGRRVQISSTMMECRALHAAFVALSLTKSHSNNPKESLDGYKPTLSIPLTVALSIEAV